MHALKISVRKPSAKGTKTKSVGRIYMEQLLSMLEHATFSSSEQPYGSLSAFLRMNFYNALFPKETLTVIATVTFPSLTGISVEILCFPTFIMATAYICFLCLNPKITSLFFRCLILYSGIIHMRFSMPFSMFVASYSAYNHSKSREIINL